ncbi:MAG: TraV family lipoprotein [Rhodospirillaceae bacterium]|nr:TraV family lipoprotein [Rhodospirillaceae bacterium]
MKNLQTTYLATLAFGAIALGGCATTHVGDDWQCPLTQGSPCLSVSAADPAAPGNPTGMGQSTGASAGARQVTGARQGAVAGQNADGPQSADANRSAGRRPAGRSPGPAYRPEGNESESSSARTGGGSEGEASSCNAWCRPFTWLWRRGGDVAAGDDPEVADEYVVERDNDPAVAPAPVTDDLRTPEIVGRIWIAPYVDDDGVYREATWVRVVLEPARWRLP